MCVTAALFACVAALAGCGGSGSDANRTDTGGSTVPSTHPLPDFAVFRRPQSESDSIPAAVLPRATAKTMRFDLGTSRLARSYRGQNVYLVASPEFVCTYSRYNPVGSCWPTATTEGGLATAASICGLGTKPREIVLFGVVPDRVKAVKVLRHGGRGPAVPVIGNVFIASASSKPPLPTKLSFVEGDGSTVHPSGIPANVAKRGCLNR